MQFLSKAKTLEYLSKKLKTVTVPKYYYFNVGEYNKHKKNYPKNSKNSREKLQLDLPQFMRIAKINLWQDIFYQN